MKKLFLFLTILAIYINVTAQHTVPLSLFSSSGGIGQTPLSQTVEWTLGETFIGDGSVGSIYTSIGEQQALPKWPLSNKQLIFKNVKVYPNPVKNYVQINNLPTGEKTILLSNMVGQTILSFSTNEIDKTISTMNISPGNYLLRIQQNAYQTISYKLTITNN